MHRLPFAPKYRERVVAGTKYATVRRGRRHAKPGQAIELRFGWRGSMPAHVTRVSFVRVADLTSADALADGFTCRDELLAALERHYPDITPDDPVTIIRFRLDRRAHGEGDPTPG